MAVVHALKVNMTLKKLGCCSAIEPTRPCVKVLDIHRRFRAFHSPSLTHLYTALLACRMGHNMGQDSLDDDAKQELFRAVEEIKGPYGLRLILG